MAETEQRERFRLQNRVVTTERFRIGASLFLGAMLVGVAGLATWLGHTWIAVPLGFAGVGVALLRTITAALQRFLP